MICIYDGLNEENEIKPFGKLYEFFKPLPVPFKFLLHICNFNEQGIFHRNKGTN